MISEEQVEQFRRSVSNYIDAYNEYIHSGLKGRRARQRKLRNAELCLDREMEDAHIWSILFEGNIIHRQEGGHLELFVLDLFIYPELEPDMTDRLGVLYGPNSGPMS
jgi:hypothetical protein